MIVNHNQCSGAHLKRALDNFAGIERRVIHGDASTATLRNFGMSAVRG
jgi:hypothetical protein